MYFITCFQKYKQTKYGVPDVGDYRTFGYYPHKERAIECLHNRLHDDCTVIEIDVTPDSYRLTDNGELRKVAEKSYRGR